MVTTIVLIFIIGYLFITFEHFTKIDKLIPALLMMTISWAVISFNIHSFSLWFDSLTSNYRDVSHYLTEHKRELLNET